MDQNAELQLVEAPLSEAVEKIRAITGLPLVIDEASLARAGISKDVPVTLTLADDGPLGRELARALSRVRLACSPLDGRLTIMSRVDADERLITRRYDVAQLVETEGGEEQLLQRIAFRIPGAAWMHTDGVGGRIEVHRDSGVLEVEQSFVVQEQIRRLLDELQSETAAAHP